MNKTRKLILRVTFLSVMLSGITPVINADFGSCPELIDATRALYGFAKENVGKLPGVLYAAKESVSNWPRQAIEQTGKILLSPISGTIATYSQYRDPRLLALAAASGIIASAGCIYLLVKKYNADKKAPSKNNSTEPAKKTSKNGYLSGALAVLAGITGMLCGKHIIKAVDSYLN